MTADIPTNTIVRNNYIEGTYWSPVVVESFTGTTNTHLAMDITVTNNTIKALAEPAIEIVNAQDILVQSNGCYNMEGNPLQDPVYVEDSINVNYP